eukprot:UN27042
MVRNRHLEKDTGRSWKNKTPVSSVSVAFELVNILRNRVLVGIQSCACWDFVLDFVQQYLHFLEKGFNEKPIIVYHWTEEDNFQSIVNGNLLVPGEVKPDGTRLNIENGSRLGVGIYAHTDPRWGRKYGKGAK